MSRMTSRYKSYLNGKVMSKSKKVLFLDKNENEFYPGNSSITPLEDARYWGGADDISLQVTQSVVDVFVKTGATADLTYYMLYPIRCLPGM